MTSNAAHAWLRLSICALLGCLALAVAAPARADARFGDRILRQGSRGSDVKTLQRVLTRLRVPTKADGAYGPRTARNVRIWERRVRGRVDGMVTRGQARNMLRILRTRTYKSADPPPATHGYVFPVRGAHNFGQSGARFGAARGGHSHQGHDVFARAGTAVVAATSGRVHRVAYQANGAGHYVIIYGDDGFDYVYMHFQSRSPVTVGSKVATGQLIGRVGCTGSCSGHHLHFEIWTPHWWDGGHPVDPLPRLRAWDRIS